MTLVKIDEANDLVGLIGLGNAGVRVAQSPLLGIAREEGQHALLTARTARNVVFFQGFLGAVGRHRVEVEIE